MIQTENSVEYIDHSAIVESVDLRSHTVTVRIDDADECGECPAAKLCSSNGRATNPVLINTADAFRYKQGDIVTIRGTEQMHRKAVMYATVLPCIALVAVMVGVYLITGNQFLAAMSGLIVTAVFFLLLWAARNKIAHEFTFTITGRPERSGTEK